MKQMWKSDSPRQLHIEIAFMRTLRARHESPLLQQVRRDCGQKFVIGRRLLRRRLNRPAMQAGDDAGQI